MKTKTMNQFIKLTLLSVLGLLCATPAAFAAGPFYWDDNAAGTGFGTAGASTGTWAAPTAGTVAGWSTSATGANAFAAVTTATSDTSENFGTPTVGLGAGTITVSGSPNSGPIIFGAASGAITISGGTKISLPNANTSITVSNAFDTISSQLVGIGTGNVLTIAGSGTLFLSGANNYGGSTTIGNNTAATLVLQANSIANVNAACSFGSGALAADCIIQIGDTSRSSTLEFVSLGGAQTSNRQIRIGRVGTGSGGATILNDDSTAANTVTFTSAPFNATASSAPARTLTLGGVNTGANTISGAIVDNATAISLVKQDTGKWVLSGTSTFTGTTTVSGGTLLVNSPGSLASGSAVTVNNGGTLGGNGTINGTVAVNTGGILAPGGINTIGKLTLSSTLALTNDTLAFDLTATTTAGTTYDQIATTGVLTSSGTQTIVVSAPAGSIATGTYTLMTYASSTAPTVKFPNGTTSMTVGTSTLTLSSSATQVQIVVGTAAAAIGFDTWKGTSASWNAANNWLLNGANTTYADPAVAYFDDTGSAASTITSSGTVSPEVAIFNNVANSYTVSATIGGSAAVIMNGTGTTTLSGPNVFTGGTTINAGTLTVNTIADSGSSALGIGTAGALNLNGGTLNYTGTGGTSTRAVNLNNSATISVPSGSSLSLGGGSSGFSGTGSSGTPLTVTGGGTLILPGTPQNSALFVNLAAGSGSEVDLAKTGGSYAVQGIGSVPSGTTVKVTAAGTLQFYAGTAIGTGINGLEGTFNLNGFSTAVPRVVGTAGTVKAGTGTSTLTLSGDTLHAYTFGGTITDGGGVLSLVKTSTSGNVNTATLSGALTYSGTTTITNGTLALSGGATLPNTPTIIIGTNGTLDVSAMTAGLTLGSGQQLSISGPGAGTTYSGTNTVASGKNLTLSAGGLAFTAYGGGSTPPLIVNGASAGSLALNSAPVTVTTTTALTPGTYTLIGASGSGTVTGTPGTLTINGSGVNGSGTLAVSSGQLQLIVGAPSITTQPTAQSTCAGSTATFSVSPTGQSYSWSKVGTGWGNAWSASGGGGIYRGTSTGNENGGGACSSFSSALDINSASGNALGIYGGGSPESATRTFTALTSGQVVSIDVDNGGVDSGKKVGFSLQTSGGSDVLQFYFLGGQSNYKYNDGTERDTGIGFLRTGLRVQFILNSATTYTLSVQSCGSTVTSFTGTYSGTIAKVKLFNENTSTGAANDAFFNNFIIGGYVDNADNYSGTGSWAGSDNGAQPIATGNGSSTYTTPTTVSGDSGSQYQVVVYNLGGAVLSSAATLTVNSLSTLTAPASQSRTVGNNVTFSVVATGGSPSATYQWRKGGVNITGATSASFTTNNVVAGSAGSYDCVVANGTCSQNSSAATLTVNVAPTITSGGQPANASACSGSSASFTNTPATGASTASYQWRQRGAGWNGGWTNSLSLGSANSNGVFVSSSTLNDATDSNNDGDINTAGRAWALYANTTATADSTRVSSNSLAISQTVQVDLDNGVVASIGSAGISLRAGGNADANTRFEVIADGGTQHYKLTDSTGVGGVDTGIALTREGVRVTFTLTGTDTYSVTLMTLVDGATYSHSGSLRNTGSIDRFRAYNFTSGSGSASDFYFNSLTFGNNSDSAADTAYSHGGTPTLTTGDAGGGLNLSTSGIYTVTSDSTKSVLTVNPVSAAASYDVVVSAGGAPSVTSTAASLTVNANPSITTAAGALASGTYNTAGYSVTISATGATGYTATGLPGGLSINGSSGVISGTPSAVGTSSSVVVTATNTSGCSDSKTYSITIGQATPTPTLTLGANVTYNGSAQAVSVTVTGGTAGTVSNVKYNGSTTTPTAAGSYTITVDFAPTDAVNYTSLTGTTVGTYTIDQATASVTANSASKLQGTTQSFAGTEFTTSGLISPDAVSTVSLSSSGAASGAAAGSYDIVPSAATGSGLVNYTISYVNGTLTVTNAPSGNLAPIASVVTVNRNTGLGIHISVTNILGHVTDPESDPITLAGFTSPSYTNLVSLTLVSNVSNYFLNYPATTNVDDRFEYWVTDGHGNYATNSVNIHVVDTTIAGTPITGQMTTNTAPGTSFTVKYFGVISNFYVLQRATNLTFAWVNIATNQMTNPPVIVIDNFTDLSVPPDAAYYRVALKP